MKGRYAKKFLPVPADSKSIVYKIYGYEIIHHHLTKGGKLRLEWMDWYKGHGENASLTCRHFGISRKTFHKWQKRYKLFGLKGLDDKSKAPKKTRQPEISQEQEKRVIKIRKEHILYGKKKKRITELQKKAIKDLLFQMDTKVIWCNPEKRYIFTKYLIPCLQSGL